MPAPWHSSEALHCAVAGPVGSRRQRGHRRSSPVSRFRPGHQGVAGEEVGVGAVGAAPSRLESNGLVPVEISSTQPPSVWHAPTSAVGTCGSHS